MCSEAAELTLPWPNSNCNPWQVKYQHFRDSTSLLPHFLLFLSSSQEALWTTNARWQFILVTSAFTWESGRLLARWLLTRSEKSTKQLKEYRGGNRKYYQAKPSSYDCFSSVNNCKCSGYRVWLSSHDIGWKAITNVIMSLENSKSPVCIDFLPSSWLVSEMPRNQEMHCDITLEIH